MDVHGDISLRPLALGKYHHIFLHKQMYACIIISAISIILFLSWVIHYRLEDEREEEEEAGEGPKNEKESEEETREEKVGGIYALLQAAVCM